MLLSLCCSYRRKQFQADSRPFFVFFDLPEEVNFPSTASTFLFLIEDEDDMVSLILVTKVVSLQCCMITSPRWRRAEEEEQRAAGIDSERLLGCGSAHPRTFARFASHVCETSPFCDENFSAHNLRTTSQRNAKK
jgi:hypothetical protein